MFNVQAALVATDELLERLEDDRLELTELLERLEDIELLERLDDIELLERLEELERELETELLERELDTELLERDVEAELEVVLQPVPVTTGTSAAPALLVPWKPNSTVWLGWMVLFQLRLVAE